MQPIRKKLLLTMMFVGLPIILLYSAVLLPIYVKLTNDITTMYTIWPNMMELVYQLVELVLFWGIYGMTIYAFWYFERKPAVPFVICGGGLIALKYLLNTVFTWLFDGFPTPSAIGGDLLYALICILIEWAQYALIILVCMYFIRSRMENLYRIEFAARKLGRNDMDAMKSVIPYKHLFDLQNPITVSAFFSVMVLAGVKIATRIIYDVSGAPNFFFQMSVTQVLWMIAYYLMDIIMGVVGYFAILYLCLKIHNGVTIKSNHLDEVSN